jgi:phage recombination protein Bet
MESEDMADKYSEVKIKLEAYCASMDGYKVHADDDRKAFIVEDGTRSVTLQVKGQKVECSDPEFIAKVMDFEMAATDGNGKTCLPVPIQDQEKANIKSLVSQIPNLGMLSAEGIRNFINPKATGQEIIDHLLIANELGLSVIKKEIYLVKRDDGSISHITGLNAFTRRAAENPDISHYKSGIITSKDGEMVFRPGCFYPSSEVLEGGWCTVYYKDGRDPLEHTVKLSEYDTGRSVWKDKKATMIEKVAKLQTLRKADPIECNCLYGAEEMGIDPSKEIRA